MDVNLTDILGYPWTILSFDTLEQASVAAASPPINTWIGKRAGGTRSQDPSWRGLKQYFTYANDSYNGCVTDILEYSWAIHCGQAPPASAGYVDPGASSPVQLGRPRRWLLVYPPFSLANPRFSACFYVFGAGPVFRRFPTTQTCPEAIFQLGIFLTRFACIAIAVAIAIAPLS